jgi:glycosyltransferase involved in cell wall biosynthesis
MSGPRLLLVNAHGADEFSGGAERYVAQLADGMGERGFDVEILSAFPSHDRGRRVTVLHDSDWRTSRSRRLRNHVGDVLAVPTKRLAEFVARAKPDLMHTNNLPGFSTAIWRVAEQHGVPVVHTLHDYHLLCPRVTLLQPDGAPCRPHPLLCGLRAKRLARWAGAVSQLIAVSNHLLDRHADLFPGVTRHTIRLLVPPPERAFPPPGDRLATLGYLGSLERTKGIERLLAAAPGLARLGCDVRIAGNGRLREEVEAAAAREPNVTYEGPVSGERKDRFFEECDAGIVPSVWEEPGAPSMTVLEWLGARRPVLVSPRGGAAEIVDELEGVIPVQPEADEIVRAIEELRSPDRWRDLLPRVHPPAASLEDWLSAHERVYREALGRA